MFYIKSIDALREVHYFPSSKPSGITSKISQEFYYLKVHCSVILIVLESHGSCHRIHRVILIYNTNEENCVGKS